MAEIVLVEMPISARVNKSGWGNCILTNPSAIKIQTTGPGAETLLNIQVPQGKQWKVSIYVEITETDT